MWPWPPSNCASDARQSKLPRNVAYNSRPQSSRSDADQNQKVSQWQPHSPVHLWTQGDRTTVLETPFSHDGHHIEKEDNFHRDVPSARARARHMSRELVDERKTRSSRDHQEPTGCRRQSEKLGDRKLTSFLCFCLFLSLSLWESVSLWSSVCISLMYNVCKDDH